MKLEYKSKRDKVNQVESSLNVYQTEIQLKNDRHVKMSSIPYKNQRISLATIATSPLWAKMLWMQV